jgi:hypothetical protein
MSKRNRNKQSPLTDSTKTCYRKGNVMDDGEIIHAPDPAMLKTAGENNNQVWLPLLVALGPSQPDVACSPGHTKFNIMPA